MSIRRRSSQAATLTGGDLSVDILHTEDSVRIGDGTNLLGSLTNVGGTYCIPVDIKQGVIGSLTDGTQRSKLTDGTDNVEIDDVGGEKALKVSVIASVGGGGGGTAATDSAAYTATATQFTPIGGAFDDASSDALSEGEMGLVRMTSARALHVDVRNASIPVTGTFWQATQPVSGTVAVTGVATEATLGSILADTAAMDTNIAAIKTAVEILDNAISGNEMQVDVITMPTVAVTGTFWQATQPVSIASMPATPVTDNGGSLTVDGTVTVQDGGSTISVDDGGGSLTVDGTVAISGSVAVTGTFWQATQPVSGTVTASNTAGDVAHDGADSGNPVKVGGVARNANPTAVANGDRVNASFDLLGKQVITPHCPRDLVTHGTGSIATTTAVTMIAAGGAGVFHDITKLVLTNSNTTTAAQVQIKDGTAGSGTTRLELVLAPSGGAVIDFGTVPMCQNTANTVWEIDLSGAVSTVYYYCQAIKRTA